MRVMGWGMVVCVAMVGGAAGEGVCFRSVGEAVRGSGVADGAGFRMEGVAWDVYRGMGWARVRSCGHPERPVMLVRGMGFEGVAGHPNREPGAIEQEHQVIEQEHQVVVAGSAVQVVSVGERVRMEFRGRAVEGGGLGDRVRVRVGVDGEERLVLCVVRSADVLEVVR